jgi:DNA-binding NarL/FixJ family response regulator
VRHIRTVIVDDQPLVRTGLRRILCAEEGFEVVAECANAIEALHAAARYKPDLVVMDVRMSGMNGAQATRELRRRDDAPPVLVLTTFGDDEVLSMSIRAGAAGFLLKDAPGEEIVRAGRLVAQGQGYIDPLVTLRVLGDYRPAVSSGSASSETGEPLTERETEVLRYVARGLSNIEIALQLGIGESTVKTHVGRILAKIAARDRAALVVYAFDHGLVQPAQDETNLL